MCFGQNTHETTHKVPMTQSIQQCQHSEVPHFKVLHLLKRLVREYDALQHCYNENQHLKMLTHQNEASNITIGGVMINNTCTQHTVRDPHGNACVRCQ